MQRISAGTIHFSELDERIRSCADSDIIVDDCTGQRYIASGLSGKRISVSGIPGNALGSYLDGCDITVNGNVQDATGDTMNGGTIVVHGNAGDATGYAMRGGGIYVRGNTGYRAGIHMKAFKEQQPAVVIGGKAGSFLGEYQAGGTIIVLDLEPPKTVDGKRVLGSPAERPITGAFCATGMHGGAIYLRTDTPPQLPSQIMIDTAKGKNIPEIAAYIDRFCEYFPDVNKSRILSSTFCILKANTKNPYKQMYTHN